MDVGLDEFIGMLLRARADFEVRWCHGEEEPCWSVGIKGENGSHAEFAFAGQGRHILTVFVD